MNLKSRRHHSEHARLAIDESIRVYDKLLLILSEHRVASDWVEHEVGTALAREQEQKHTMLFPIRLDDDVPARQSGNPNEWNSREEAQDAQNGMIGRSRSCGSLCVAAHGSGVSSDSAFAAIQSAPSRSFASARLLRDLKA